MQIVIDSCCTTFAEVQKRRKDVWAEFELYVADLLVSVAVDIALVGLMAPYVRIEKPSSSTSLEDSAGWLDLCEAGKISFRVVVSGDLYHTMKNN